MTYEAIATTIEKSSWYKELIERNAAERLVRLPLPKFKRELLVVIDRHRRQQTHIEKLKRSCRVH